MKSPRHLDDFTLLRFTAADLDAAERAAAEEHLLACAQCNVVLESLARLDAELRVLAKTAAGATATAASSGSASPTGASIAGTGGAAGRGSGTRAAGDGTQGSEAP